jgi:V8-like Glu-specific endopeptidase
VNDRLQYLTDTEPGSSGSPSSTTRGSVLGHLKLTLCGHQELTHPPGGAAFVATRN